MSKKLQDLLQRTIPELKEALFLLKAFNTFERHGPRVQTLLNDIESALKELQVPREAPAPCPPSPPALLDQFALAALPAILAACHPKHVSVDYDEIAYLAYTMARAAMRMRDSDMPY